VDAFVELLAYLKCAGPLRNDLSCRDCGMRYEAPDGIPNLRLPGDGRTEIVRDFYEEVPFPDYPPRASLSWLRRRAERSGWALRRRDVSTSVRYSSSKTTCIIPACEPVLSM
jgi:uncharacterized protein YbaR (Trm112 family)